MIRKKEVYESEDSLIKIQRGQSKRIQGKQKGKKGGSLKHFRAYSARLFFSVT